ELDPFMASRNLAHLDVLHVDIQGSENDLLVGGRDSLTRALVDYIFISTHSQAKHQQVIAQLGGYGYCVGVSSDFDNETTSFDGFVFASSPKVRPLFTGFTHLGREAIATEGPDRILQALNKAQNAIDGNKPRPSRRGFTVASRLNA